MLSCIADLKKVATSNKNKRQGSNSGMNYYLLNKSGEQSSKKGKKNYNNKQYSGALHMYN